MPAWYTYPVTHGYITAYEGQGTDTPHYAEDIGTPFHTPLTAILPGTVKQADYQAWGGEIFIQPDNKSFPEYYYFHPDEIEVHAGQHVNAGQQIALSGGENPGFPGAEHPAQTKYSSGPHTHIGWFEKYVSTPMGEEPYGPDPSNLLQMAGSGGQSSPVPQSVYNAIEPIAQQQGVPDPIWETVAQVESGFNPSALGDQGTSYGIFQLHIGGQFPSQYLSNPTALNDPALNAQFAMPGIARAWQALGSSFDPSSSAWWESFAAQSGHPGGAPGETVTDAEATRLQQEYSQFSTGAPAFSIPGLSGLTSGLTDWIGSHAGPFFLRIGVGLAGLALIWAGVNEVGASFKDEPGPAPETPPKEEEKPAEKASEEEKPASEKKEEKPEEEPKKVEEKAA